MKTPLVILGAGGFAKEAFSWLPHDQYQVEAFYSIQSILGQSLYGAPLVSSLQGFSDAFFLVAVGDPQDREFLWQRAVEAGLRPCPAIIHPTVVMGRNAAVGDGSIICPYSVISADVEIGDGVIVNLNSTIGHDTRVGNFVTISPGANISGKCSISGGAYIGTNSALKEGVTIELDAVVGMGAVVTKDVPRGTIVVGNPARRLGSDPVL